MTRSTSWDQSLPSTPRAQGAWSWVALGLLAVLLLGFCAASLHGSVAHPRLAASLFHALDSEEQARRLFRETPGLQAGWGSETAFLQHLRTWKPQFGTTDSFLGPDAAKRFLPFAAKLEIQGSGGAWFAILGRQGPFQRVHGIAFGPTQERARSACFNQYAKQYLKPWLERGLAEAHHLAEQSSASASLPLTVAEVQWLRALPDQTRLLDPTCFAFLFVPGGARMQLTLGSGRVLSLDWKDDSPPGECAPALAAENFFR